MHTETIAERITGEKNAFQLGPVSAIFRWVLMLAVLIVPQVVKAQWHATA
jgi:hypothetical protein